MRCFMTAVTKGLEQAGDIFGLVKNLDMIEGAVMARLQRSSQSWGRAAALLTLVCLDVSIVSLINLFVMQLSTVFVLHQVTILAFCLLILPIQLSKHIAHITNVFDGEVVPTINRPLMLWAEARHKQLGGAVLSHLQEMRTTWCVRMGGITVSADRIASFIMVASFIFVLALYHTTVMQSRQQWI